MSFGTVPCDECSGGGELVVLEDNAGDERVEKGTVAFDLLDGRGDEWEMVGTRECSRCHGFGRLNRAEV